VECLTILVGQRLVLPGYFESEVVVEAARSLGSSIELRVRLPTGDLDEAVLPAAEIESLLNRQPAPTTAVRPVDAEQLRLLVESARIRLAYREDPAPPQVPFSESRTREDPGQGYCRAEK
jgi:hypothetical protein